MELNKNKIRLKDFSLMRKLKIKGSKICIVCKIKSANQTHHITYEPNPNKLSKILDICGSCHHKIHSLRKKIDLFLIEIKKYGINSPKIEEFRKRNHL